VVTKAGLTVYHGSQFYWWRKPEYLEKITDLTQVTDKHYHIMSWLETLHHGMGKISLRIFFLD
jgi:hypothetical protein